MTTAKREFLSPRAALEHARKINFSDAPKGKLFNDSRLRNPLEQYWCAGMFGLGYEQRVKRTCLVAPNPDVNNDRRDADFFALLSDKEHAFQVVEAMTPGRLRGKEYKQLQRTGHLQTDYDPERGHIEGAQWIAGRVAEKAAIRYAGADNLHLVVNANFSARGLEYGKIVEATRPYRGEFASIWVLADGLLCTAHSNSDIGFIEGWGIIENV